MVWVLIFVLCDGSDGQALAEGLLREKTEAPIFQSLVTVGMRTWCADRKDEKLLGLLSGTDGGPGVAVAPESMTDADIMDVALLTLATPVSSQVDFKDLCIRTTRSELDDPNCRRVGLMGCSSVRNLLFDMLKRQQDISKYLAWIFGERDLRRDFEQVAARELYIAMIHSMSPTTQASVAMSMAKADIAVPLVYSWSVKRLDSGSPANHHFHTIANFHVLQEVACVARQAFLVNIGTHAVRGKTRSLRELFTSGRLFESQPSPSSLQQMPGIDVLPDIASEKSHRNLTLLDVHRPHFGDPVFCATLKALLGFSRLVLLHTGAVDLSDSAEEFEELLYTLRLMPDDCQVVLVYRDAVAEDDEGDVDAGEALLHLVKEVLGDRIAFIVNLPDMRTLGGEECRQRQWLNTAWQQSGIVEELQRASLCPPAPSVKELHASFQNHMGIQRHWASQGPPLSQRIVRTLGSLAEKQQLIQTLFPVTFHVQQLIQLEKEQKKASEDNDITRCDEIAMQMKMLKQSLAKPRNNKEMQTFADLAFRGERLEELHHAIGDWKNTFQQPLIDRLSNLRNKCGQDGCFKGTQAQLEKEREDLLMALTESDVSLDSFWQELLLMSAWQVDGVPELQLNKSYVKWLRCGQPIQLLHGNPLAFGFKSSIDEKDPRDCLPAILAGMAAQLGFEHSPIMVISVLGAQSSGKSTLLNFLFGCSFVTLAGRCTMGLYLSLIRVGDQLVGILDSEGILSPDGTREPVFDAQIAMMALACSHVVVVNSRGEVGKPILDLLSVCMFAIKRLSVCQVKPVLAFVVGQHLDIAETKKQQMFTTSILEPLQASCEKLSNLRVQGVKLSDLMQVSCENFFVMSSAYSMHVDWNGQRVRNISQAFPEDAIKVREALLAAGRTAAASGCPWSTSVGDWYAHASSIWAVLQQNSSDILCFRDLFEAELGIQMKDYVVDLQRQEVHGSLRSQLEEEMNSMMGLLEKANLEDLKSVHRDFCDFVEGKKEEAMLRLETGQVPKKFAKKKELLQAYLPIYRNAVRRACALARSTWQSRYNMCYQNKMAEDRECRIVKQVEEILKTVTPSTLEQAKAEFEKAFEEAGLVA